MSWQQAKEEAEKRIAASGLPEGSLEGRVITLIACADNETYRQLNWQVAEKWSLAFFRMVTTAECRMLRKLGAYVTYKTVKLSDDIPPDLIFVGKSEEFLKAKSLKNPKAQKESALEIRRAELETLQPL